MLSLVVAQLWDMEPQWCKRRLLAFSSDSEIQFVKECSIEMESRSCFVMSMSVIGEDEVYDLEDHSTMLSLEMSIIELD
jgi:hypothetical protein